MPGREDERRGAAPQPGPVLCLGVAVTEVPNVYTVNKVLIASEAPSAGRGAPRWRVSGQQDAAAPRPYVAPTRRGASHISASNSINKHKVKEKPKLGPDTLSVPL